jgi:hypothetical protein
MATLRWKITGQRKVLFEGCAIERAFKFTGLGTKWHPDRSKTVERNTMRRI